MGTLGGKGLKNTNLAIFMTSLLPILILNIAVDLGLKEIN